MEGEEKVLTLFQMAAASFLVPSLSGLNSRPNRIRHSVQVNIRRRERITPPPIVTSKRLSSLQVGLLEIVSKLLMYTFGFVVSLRNHCKTSFIQKSVQALIN